MNESEKEVVASAIIGAAIEVHRLLGGPGLIESVYESALCHELSAKLKANANPCRLQRNPR